MPSIYPVYCRLPPESIWAFLQLLLALSLSLSKKKQLHRPLFPYSPASPLDDAPRDGTLFHTQGSKERFLGSQARNPCASSSYLGAKDRRTNGAVRFVARFASREARRRTRAAERVRRIGREPQRNSIETMEPLDQLDDHEIHPSQAGGFFPLPC